MELARVKVLSPSWRARFLAKKKKAAALARLRRGPVPFDLPPLSLILRDISGLGTLQSSIVDTYNEVVMADILPEEPLVIDVGANIGQFVNAAKLFFPRARVVCFEPDPETFLDLRRNTAGLPRVEVHNVGLGERDETITYYRQKLSAMSSFSRGADLVADRRGAIALRVVRLDDLVDRSTCPDLVKVDVEGFERKVLEGGWETIKRSRYLLIELSLTRSEGVENLELLRDVADHVPGASILRFGRPLGEKNRPTCQDVLIALRGVPKRSAPSIL